MGQKKFPPWGLTRGCENVSTELRQSSLCLKMGETMIGMRSKAGDNLVRGLGVEGNRLRGSMRVIRKVYGGVIDGGVHWNGKVSKDRSETMAEVRWCLCVCVCWYGGRRGRGGMEGVRKILLCGRILIERIFRGKARDVQATRQKWIEVWGRMVTHDERGSNG